MKPDTNWQLLTLMVIGLLAGIVCTKKTLSDNQKKVFLSNKSWLLTNVFYQLKSDPSGVDFTDILYKNCSLDDSYHFYEDGKFERRDSMLVCGQSYVPFGPYGRSSWNINETFTILQVTMPLTYNFEFEIVSISNERMVLKQYLRDYLQQDIVHTFYFKAAR